MSFAHAEAKAATKTPEETGNKMHHANPCQIVNPTADCILALQRSLGNLAVQRLLKSDFIQAKLQIGTSNDVCEEEADRVAQSVLRSPVVLEHHERGPNHAKIDAKHLPSVGMLSASEDSKPEAIDALERSVNSLSASGQKLPESVTSYFEPRFGHDFSEARIHTDTSAARLAQTVNTRAFTSGQNIVFGAGQYSPNTQAGQQVIAHELAHTLQQRQGVEIRRQKKDKGSAAPKKAEEIKCPNPGAVTTAIGQAKESS